MPMKTNTPPNPETQARIHQLKLSVDWHVEQFRVVRMCDGQSPQPAQRFTPASFHEKAVKLLFRGTSIYLVGG